MAKKTHFSLLIDTKRKLIKRTTVSAVRHTDVMPTGKIVIIQCRRFALDNRSNVSVSFQSLAIMPNDESNAITHTYTHIYGIFIEKSPLVGLT